MSYVVGVDGGATKTAGILLDLRGRILARKTVGPTNYQIVGAIGVGREVSQLVPQLFAAAGIAPEELAGLALGLAGVGRPGEAEKVAGVVAEYELAGRLVVEHDAMIALVGALAGWPGLVMIAGTGSIVLGRSAAGDRARVGGWGYLLGDEGSGFFIARQALMAVLKAHDGRGRETILSKVILDGLKLGSPDLIVPRIYRQGMSHAEIADLAPLVFAAAGEGDAVALEILGRAGRELGLMVATAIRKLGMEGETVKVGMVGSLFKDRDMLLDQIRKGLGEGFRVEFVTARLAPVGGAAILALEAAGVAVTGKLIGRLEDQLREPA